MLGKFCLIWSLTQDQCEYYRKIKIYVSSMELLSFCLGVLRFAVKTTPDVYVCMAHVHTYDIVQFTYPNMYFTALVSIALCKR